MAALIAAALLVLSSGCGGDTSGPGDGMIPVKPGVGSFYIYKGVSDDAGGSPATIRFDTISVRSTNATLQEMTGLISLWSTATRTFGYMRYEGNGDLTMYEPRYTGDSTAEMIATTFYPLGRHTSTQLNTDSTYISSGYKVRYDSLLYAGTQSLTVPAGTFTVAKVITVNDTRLYTSTGAMTGRVREAWSYYFAPSIGFFIKVDLEHIFFDAAGTITSHQTPDVIELTAYRIQ